jgi:hypothetical protein
MMRAAMLMGILLLTPNLWAEPFSFSFDPAKHEADRDYKARAQQRLAEVNHCLAIQRDDPYFSCH